MKQFIYLDTDIVTSIIAQEEKGYRSITQLAGTDRCNNACKNEIKQQRKRE